MSWTRRELKESGKLAFYGNRWACVGNILLLNVAYVVFACVNSFASIAPVLDDSLSGIAFAASIAALLIGILIVNPMEVGLQKFFLRNRNGAPEKGVLFSVFHDGYGNIVKTIFLRNLYIALWSILFLIPGLVKAYSYRMVPYILAESPELNSREIFQRSKDMMNGQKWNAFVLDLSFIGWWMLSSLTFGILGIVYTAPYQTATNAELYQALGGGVSKREIWVVCKSGPLMGGVYPVTAAKPVSIGRFSSNAIRFPQNYPGISREHARVYWENGALLLTDCGSTSGTFLNDGERLIAMQPREVHPGDTFFLADRQNLFEIKA